MNLLKKILSLLITCIIISGNILSVSATSSIANNMLVISKTELETTVKGKKYIRQIDNLIDTYKNNEKVLQKLEFKLYWLVEKLQNDNSVKNRQLKNLINYFYLKVIIVLDENILDEKTVEQNELVMTVIDDKRCIDCPTKEILEQIKTIPVLANVNIIEKDFLDEGVKEYLEQNEIRALPAIIFNSSNVEEWMNPYLTQLKSGEYTLALWSSFNPFVEICDNGIDDTQNWQIDCEDTTCSSKSICRTEEKAKLDVFLMGYCPFWEIAAKAIPSLKETFWDDLNIDVHFIASKTGDWKTAKDFNSLHWTPEVEEDIRQLCIKRDYWIDTLIKYFGERYKNADNYGVVTDKPSVAYDAVWIDWVKIDACVTNWEGGKLLEEDIKLAQELNINWSPTWLANNKYTFGWIDANTIQSEFCKYNSELEACSNTIKSISPTWDTPACN